MATFTLTGNLDQFTGVPSLATTVTIIANAQVFDATNNKVFERATVRLTAGTFSVTLPARAAGTTPDDWTYILARKGLDPIYVPAQTTGTYDVADVMVPSEEPPAGWDGPSGSEAITNGTAAPGVDTPGSIYIQTEE